MKTLTLTDAQAKALVSEVERLAQNAPEGADVIIRSDILRSLFLQLRSQSIAIPRRRDRSKTRR